MTITERLAEFVVGFDPRSSSDEVVDVAKIMILDGLGCMIAGSSHPAIRILIDYAEEQGGHEYCTVVGAPHRTSAPMAALINGAMLHVNDFEIQGVQRGSHGTSNLLPPAFALAEQFGGTGWDVLGAIIVGWEVNQRLRVAAPEFLFGFHPPGIIGPMGAATASGKLLGLTKQQLKMAYGIAASRAGSINANVGSMVKCTHPGNAGRMGVEAALLARRGFESNPDIFDDPRGYIYTIFRSVFDEEVFFRNMGEASFMVNWEKDEKPFPLYAFHIKPYPAERWMQRVIEAVQGIEGRRLISPKAVDYIELEMAPARGGEVETYTKSRPKPRSGLDGKFSYEYCAAVGFLEERVGLKSFSNEVRFSPEVQAMLPKVRIVPNQSIPRTFLDCWVTARVGLDDGRVLESTSKDFRGSARNPMTREERLRKFRHCTDGLLTVTDTNAVIEAVDHLEQDGNLNEVLRALSAVREVVAG